MFWRSILALTVNGTKALRKQYGKSYTFVLVYVVDPHPLPPDVSVYRGQPWTFAYSKYPQALTLDERIKYANSVSTEDTFDEVLVDWLAPQNATGNNPTWCAWGPCPNCAWLIEQSGEVKLAQDWFEEGAMGQAMAGGARRNQ
jgi:hypothetical protein